MVIFFLSENNKFETGFRPIRDLQRYQPVDITEYLQQLDGDVRDYTMQLQSEKYVLYVEYINVEVTVTSLTGDLDLLSQ